MRNFTKLLFSVSLCTAMLFSALAVEAQTDARPDEMKQIVPQSQQELITPPVEDLENIVTETEDNAISPGILIPPPARKVKAEKGFFGRLLDKLNPLNWFNKFKAQLSTGLLLMIIGLGMVVIGYILCLAFATGSGGFGSFFLGALLIYLGWILFLVGGILWIIELVND